MLYAKYISFYYIFKYIIFEESKLVWNASCITCKCVYKLYHLLFFSSFFPLLSVFSLLLRLGMWDLVDGAHVCGWLWCEEQESYQNYQQVESSLQVVCPLIGFESFKSWSWGNWSICFEVRDLSLLSLYLPSPSPLSFFISVTALLRHQWHGYDSDKLFLSPFLFFSLLISYFPPSLHGVSICW